MEMKYYPNSGKEAREKGYEYYFTGKPCKYGHFSLRHAKQQNCYECYKFYQQQWHQNNKERRNERSRELYHENKEYYRLVQKQWNQDNKEYVRAASKQRYEKNKDRKNELAKQWHNRNKDYHTYLQTQWRERNIEYARSYDAHYTRKRTAYKNQAIPKWADMETIKDVYINCPGGCEVDHIVPIKGKNVCGLHVADNLQYLTPEENNFKRNKFDETILQYLPEGVEP